VVRVVSLLMRSAVGSTLSALVADASVCSGNLTTTSQSAYLDLQARLAQRVDAANSLAEALRLEVEAGATAAAQRSGEAVCVCVCVCVKRVRGRSISLSLHSLAFVNHIIRKSLSM
jgi:hypothetical protein